MVRIWTEAGQREVGEQKHGRWTCPLHKWRVPVGTVGYEIVQREQPSYRPAKQGAIIQLHVVGSRTLGLRWWKCLSFRGARKAQREENRLRVAAVGVGVYVRDPQKKELDKGVQQDSQTWLRGFKSGWLGGWSSREGDLERGVSLCEGWSGTIGRVDEFGFRYLNISHDCETSKEKCH